MAAESRPVLALDIGGTKLAVGVVTPDGDIRGYLVEPTRKDDGHEGGHPPPVRHGAAGDPATPGSAPWPPWESAAAGRSTPRRAS